jgi:CHAT domain/SIR2-like domain
MTEYADLIIELSRQAENQYWVRLSFSQPDGQAQIAPQSGPAAFDFNALRASALQPEAYGVALRAAVFPSEDLRTFYQKCLASSAQANQELRARILIDRSALELHNLHWETLRDPDDQSPLSGDPNRPFSRFLATTDWRRVELRSRGRLRALVVIASPSELESGLSLGGRSLAAVDVQAEAQRALQGLREAPLAQGIRSVPEVTFLADAMRLNSPTKGRASLEALQLQLLEGYDIVYLVAHGALLPDQPGNPTSPFLPYILLEKEDGSYDRRPGQDLINLITSLPLIKRPRLVVLASCQSGGRGKVPSGPPDEPERSYDEGALAALGPRLAEAGVPAVLAMQDNVRMSSMAQFIPLFFSQLLEHGQVDKAAAVARQALLQAKVSDWWVPVLYLRLLGGLLWFNPGFTRKEDFEGWPGILNSLEQQACVPILGFGLLEPLIGSSREIARSWAESAGYPLDPHSQDDLTQVAQYLSIKQKPAYPRNQLLKHIRSRLIATYKLPIEENENRPMEELISLIADEILKDPDQPYNVLARLPVKIYINANPDNILELALRKHGREPLAMYSRWNKSLEDADTIEASSRLVEISVHRPLVYYLFGRTNLPKSLVLSEDDYFEYLMWVNNPAAKIRLPEPVITSWRDDALLFLGFQLDDWNFRALFRSILYGDRRRSIRDYPSVAVQLQPGGGYLNAESARRYLADTFRNDQVDIYWGSGEDFLGELNRQASEELKV